MITLVFLLSQIRRFTVFANYTLVMSLILISRFYRHVKFFT